MRNRLISVLTRLICKRPMTIVVVSLTLAVLSAVYSAAALRMNANTDDLIGKDRPFYADYRRFLDEFGDLEFIHVVVDGGERAERAERCVDAIVERLTAAGIQNVHGFIDAREQRRIATRAMSERDLADLTAAAAVLPALRAGPRAALAAAAERMTGLISEAVTLTPPEQRERGAAALLPLEVIVSADGRSGADVLGGPLPRQYLLSDSGRLHFVLVMAEKDYRTATLIEEPLRIIRAELAKVRAEFDDIEIGLTGRPVLQADEMRTTAGDMMRASIAAFVLVALLFMVMIGGVWRPILAVVALLCSLAWTFGLTTLVIGQLNLLSIVFALILVGIGIDFGVHVIARYNEQRHHHDDPRHAIAATLETAGRGNLTGAVTSSIAFFMAILTDFQGLRELGFVAGSGLLLCLGAMTFLLPSLLLLTDRGGERGELEGRSDDGPTVLSRGADLLERHSITTLVLAAVASVALLPAIRSVSFEGNLLELQAVGLESVEWEQRIMEDSVAATWFGAITVDDVETIEPVRAQAARLETVGATRSILDVIRPPSPGRDELRRRLRAAATAEPPAVAGAWGAADLRRALVPLQTLARLARAGDPAEAERLAGLHERLKLLADALDGPQAGEVRGRIEASLAAATSAVDEMLEGDAAPLRAALPAAVRRQFVSPGGRLLVMLHPAEDVWQYASMRRFVEELRQIDEHVTGAPISTYESLGEMKESFQLAALLALGAVFALVLLDFRHLEDALLAMLPLLVGLLWTAQWMGLAGIGFNLANFFSIPILTGIGVANGVHLLHRYREGGPQRLQFGSTLRASILTSLTTMIGFGCLATATHRGLRSLGLVMVLGSAACLISTMLLLPAMLGVVDRRRLRKEQRGAG